MIPVRYVQDPERSRKHRLTAIATVDSVVDMTGYKLSTVRRWVTRQRVSSRVEDGVTWITVYTLPSEAWNKVISAIAEV